MKLLIEINLDNAAFDDDPGRELDNILMYLPDNLETIKAIVEQTFILKDSNGNTVGTVEVK